MARYSAERSVERKGGGTLNPSTNSAVSIKRALGGEDKHGGRLSADYSMTQAQEARNRFHGNGVQPSVLVETDDA